MIKFQVIRKFKIVIFFCGVFFTSVSYSQPTNLSQTINVSDTGFIFFTAPHDNVLFIPSKYSKIDSLLKLDSIWGIQIHLSEIRLETDKLLDKLESTRKIHLIYANRRKTDVSFWRVILKFDIPISELNSKISRSPINIMSEYGKLKVCFFTKSVSNYYSSGNIVKVLE